MALLQKTLALFIVSAYLLIQLVITVQADDSLPAASIESTKITLSNIYAWRDWQPHVLRAGGDGGSPLMVIASFEFLNQNNDEKEVEWMAYIKTPGSKKIFPIEIWDSDSKFPWAGILKGNERKTVSLRTYSGPYLEPGSKVTFVFDFVVNGESINIESNTVNIEQTH